MLLCENFVSSLKTNALLGDTTPTKYHHSSRQKLDCCSPSCRYILQTAALLLLLPWSRGLTEFLQRSSKDSNEKTTKRRRKQKPGKNPTETPKREENFGMPWILVRKYSALGKFCSVTNSHCFAAVFLPLLFNYSFGAQNFSRAKVWCWRLPCFSTRISMQNSKYWSHFREALRLFDVLEWGGLLTFAALKMLSRSCENGTFVRLLTL